MTPSQRTILLSLTAGAAGFVSLFALGVLWPVGLGLGVLLMASTWLALNYLAPTDKQSELEATFRGIDRAAAKIRVLSLRVADRETATALQSGCDGIPQMIQIMRDKDIRVALPLSQRSLAYLDNVARTLEDYIDVEVGGDPEYLRQGRQELQRMTAFTSQPTKELSAQKMDDYISSLTALNLNPPPELP